MLTKIDIIVELQFITVRYCIIITTNILYTKYNSQFSTILNSNKKIKIHGKYNIIFKTKLYGLYPISIMPGQPRHLVPIWRLNFSQGIKAWITFLIGIGTN